MLLRRGLREPLGRPQQADVRHVAPEEFVADLHRRQRPDGVGRRGNPVCFGSAWFDALRGVDGDIGGREILLTAPDAALVEPNDPGVRRDVDRPSALPE